MTDAIVSSANREETIGVAVAAALHRTLYCDMDPQSILRTAKLVVTVVVAVVRVEWRSKSVEDNAFW